MMAEHLDLDQMVEMKVEVMELVFQVEMMVVHLD